MDPNYAIVIAALTLLVGSTSKLAFVLWSNDDDMCLWATVAEWSFSFSLLVFLGILALIFPERFGE